VLLVGPASFSAAENFSLLLTGALRGHVVGQVSAGTNGNVTSVQLPGHFNFRFTGMQLLDPAGGRFMGVGIVPDIPVDPDPLDLAAGKDPELLRAIQPLHGH
jgi:C-terminal processing protease CtpA/Prc